MTLSERSEELINREIDGELSDDEQQDLDRLLEGDPEAAERRRELRHMAGLLDRLEETPAPPDLKAGIITAVSAGRQADQGHAVISVRGARSRTMHGLSFAVGLAAGVVLFAVYALLVVKGPTPDPMQAIGGLLPGDQLEPGTAVESKSVTVGGMMVKCESRRIGDISIADIAAGGQGDSRIGVQYDDEALQFVGVDPGTAGSVSVQREMAGHISLDSHGMMAIRLLFAAIESESGMLNITITRGGETAQLSLATQHGSD